jgi:hypothetical protein
VAEKNVGYYSPALARRIKDAALAYEREGSTRPEEIERTIPPPIYVRNVSTYTIPAYGLMQMVGAGEIDGENFIEVTRPIDYTDSVMGPILVNGPSEIEPDDFGMAQFGPVYRVKTDGTTYSTGTRIGPVADSFEASKGCIFSCIGPDDIEEDVIKIIACETPLLAVCGGSGIGANSSGTVTAKQPAGGNWAAGSVTYEAWNPTGTAIGSNKTVLLFPVDLKWLATELC